jgi:branched-chain amino acid transport system ATP-binding protein
MYAQRLPKRAAMRVAGRLLDTVGLADSAARPAGQLAVADVRRLELARALAAGPSVLILDEILAGLAHGELAAGLEVLLRLKNGDMTMVIVEHHMGAVKALCDEVLVLVRGALVSKGPPSSVLADPKVIRAYLGGHPGVAP